MGMVKTMRGGARGASACGSDAGVSKVILRSLLKRKYDRHGPLDLGRATNVL